MNEFKQYLKIYLMLLRLPPRGRGGRDYYDVTKLSPFVALPASIIEIIIVSITAILIDPKISYFISNIITLNERWHFVVYFIEAIIIHFTFGGAFLFFIWAAFSNYFD